MGSDQQVILYSRKKYAVDFPWNGALVYFVHPPTQTHTSTEYTPFWTHSLYPTVINAGIAASHPLLLSSSSK
ncbi:hypothetical protein M413DRAFT_30499 [Hebeloma cylindrosporum]|uniref:Uncharacterized protein n=1 Tax=Hebeloma cylindrosporum TaxID=76867 RepID=A0A0C3C3G8_HEBCY|nr:hypothetical protein M413DRAFT_30499 [Hebeloma cylindrosporum h7]